MPELRNYIILSLTPFKILFYKTTSINITESKVQYSQNATATTHSLTSVAMAMAPDESEHDEQHLLRMELISIEPQKMKQKPSDFVSKINRPLLDFLSNSAAFEAFMVYLSHEFSMENLLSFVEFLQFQKYVDTKTEVKKRKELLCDIFKLPDTVPLSVIVYDEELDIKTKACLLYDKYIGNDSIYTINISFRVKYRVTKVVDGYSKMESD